MANGFAEASSALPQVAQRLDAAGIPWAVFAGTAASLYGASRPVTDLDILVPAAEVDRVAALFPEADVHQHEGCLCAFALPGVDMVVGLKTMDLDASMAGRLTRHRVLGVSVPVIPREDNILLKAMLGRGLAAGKHDWEDVEAMMRHAPSLDWEYLRWRAATLGPCDSLRPELERLEALWLGVGGRHIAAGSRGIELEEKNDQAGIPG